MADNWMLGETAALDDYTPTPSSNVLGNAAQGVKDWWANQPSWLDRAQAENQRTAEAYQRGGMGEIARQLATDTTEAQDLAAGFGGNIKGVKPPVAPGALAAIGEYRPPFYSAVEQAVQGAKQNAAPGQQWAGFLRNQPGVKPEEVEALKLGKLFEQPGSVPKEAVLGEIAANRVNVGETVFGQNAKTMDAIAKDLGYGGWRSSLTEAQKAEVNAAYDAQGMRAGTKFQQYILPGGENYREMLLTLPKKPVDIGPAPELITELPKGPDWENSYRVIHYGSDPPERAYGVIPPGQSHARAMAGQHPTPEEATRQALNHINAHNAQQYNQALHDANKGGTFTSSHFDEPNVLAHVRYNDRVIDGKKTLFVEEVQSDWHQKGKREGYRSEPSAAENELLQLRHKYDPTNQAALSPAEHARMSELESQVGHGLANKVRESAVPDAPFKTTWPELAMKRIIREAAEKGYDKVAWTPGSVQAERYDLSKHVDGIRWEPTISTPDQRVVRIDPRDGKTINLQIDKSGTVVSSFPRSNGNQFEGRHLSDVIGKDIAEKIISGKEAGFLKDLDLKVGGEGMKGFYDEILPATVNRLVKKHGGRVEQADMRSHQYKGYESFGAGEGPLGGPALFGIDKDGKWTLIRQDFAGDRDMAIRMADQLNAGGGSQKVHSLEITPSLRAAAMKGFPLFSAGGVAATGAIGELARQDEYR